MQLGQANQKIEVTGEAPEVQGGVSQSFLLQRNCLQYILTGTLPEFDEQRPKNSIALLLQIPTPAGNGSVEFEANWTHCHLRARFPTRV